MMHMHRMLNTATHTVTAVLFFLLFAVAVVIVTIQYNFCTSSRAHPAVVVAAGREIWFYFAAMEGHHRGVLWGLQTGSESNHNRYRDDSVRGEGFKGSPHINGSLTLCKAN